MPGEQPSQFSEALRRFSENAVHILSMGAVAEQSSRRHTDTVLFLPMRVGSSRSASHNIRSAMVIAARSDDLEFLLISAKARAAESPAVRRLVPGCHLIPR